MHPRQRIVPITYNKLSKNLLWACGSSSVYRPQCHASVALLTVFFLVTVFVFVAILRFVLVRSEVKGFYPL